MQLVCNTIQISQVTNKLNIEPKQKDQTFMVMDRINRYGVLNLCIIYNQVTESSFLSQDTLYTIN